MKIPWKKPILGVANVFKICNRKARYIVYIVHIIIMDRSTVKINALYL